MIKSFWCLCWLVVSPSLFAASSKLDTLAVGPTTYSNVTVLGANTTDIYFTHDHGIANVKLKYLSPDLQKRFNFDPKLAAEAERKQAEEDARYQSRLATMIATQAEAQARMTKEANAITEDNLADPVSDASLLKKPAPALKVEKWLSDQPSSEGKYMLVSFWAPWSPACRKSIPNLNALQKRFSDHLVVVGVSLDPEAKVAEMSEPKIEFASAVDTKGKLLSAAGVTSIPCVLLIDPKGIVRYQGHPAAITEARLQTLLAKPSD